MIRQETKHASSTTIDLLLMQSLSDHMERLQGTEDYDEAARQLSTDYKSPIDPRNWGLTEYVQAFILAICMGKSTNLTSICTAWAERLKREHECLQGEANLRSILEYYAPETQIDLYFLQTALEIRRRRSNWPSAEHIRDLVYYHVATEHGGARVDFHRVFGRWPDNELQMECLTHLRHEFYVNEGRTGTLEDLKVYAQGPGVIERIQLSVEYLYIFGEWPLLDIQCQYIAELRIRFDAEHKRQATVDELKTLMEQPEVFEAIQRGVEYHYIFGEWAENTDLHRYVDILKAHFQALHGRPGTLDELQALADQQTQLAADPEAYHQEHKVYVGLEDMSKLPEVEVGEGDAKVREGNLCGWCQEELQVGQVAIQLPCKCSLSLYHTSGCLEGSTVRTWFTSHKTCPGCRQEVNL